MIIVIKKTDMKTAYAGPACQSDLDSGEPWMVGGVVMEVCPNLNICRP